MAGCNHNIEPFDGQSPAYKRLLSAVIVINATMFLVEIVAGYAAGSKALQADALDFAGDTATYVLTMMVIGHSLPWRARAALFKGLTLAALGLWVLGSTVWQVLVLGVPRAEIMGAIGFLALAANLTSVVLLMSYRNGDANVRSVWLCSRNDAIGNVAVIAAAGAVWLSASPWPDLVVAAAIASLFLWSSVQIILHARTELRVPSPDTAMERDLVA